MTASGKKQLRTGFSTGSAAAAAAKAALLHLLGCPLSGSVSIPLPSGDRLEIALAKSEHLAEGQAEAVVVKDAGDDPDVTHRARVSATVELLPPGPDPALEFRGGPGVGLVTRPGLPVAVGQPAINPVPRQMIAAALAEAWRTAGPGGELRAAVTIAVENGAELAKRTLNPRLGIVGGVSILGTSGLVKPLSHEAYTATIESALAVARAAGIAETVLTTGGRSEKRAMALRPDLPPLAFVQIADYFAFALTAAVKAGMTRVGLVSYFGKAVKQAQGLTCTHAHRAAMDLATLADWLAEAGAPAGLVEEVARANTARHVLEILTEAGRLDLTAPVVPRLLAAARRIVGPGPDLWAVMLDSDGAVLARGELPGEGLA